MTDTTNPKDLQGVKKAPLRYVPAALMIEVSDAMANGAGRYGPFNFRKTDIRSTVYLEAIMRHLFAYMDGEDNAQDSGCSHLSHMGACIAILIDARETGHLIDDRYNDGPASKMLSARDLTKKGNDENISE